MLVIIVYLLRTSKILTLPFFFSIIIGISIGEHRNFRMGRGKPPKESPIRTKRPADGEKCSRKDPTWGAEGVGGG